MKKYFILLSLVFIFQGTMAQSCLPDGIYFYSQEEIDSFQVNFPNCTRIDGEVVITNAFDLNGLSTLTYIGGDLSINYNSYLYDLSGLENLDSIGGNLYIQNNDVLTTLNGLGGLKTVGADIYIMENEALQDLSGLDSLVYVKTFIIEHNIALTELSGIPSLNSCDQLIIESNNRLNDLTGLENIGTLFDLWIENNDSLSSLNGLENLTELQNSLFITDNSLLVSLSALEAINSTGQIMIEYNPALPDLTGLQNLTNIDYSLYIDGNASLSDLSGLDNLRTIGTDLRINSNSSLVNLHGLDSLTHIGGTLEIGSIYTDPNYALTSLAGIDNVEGASISNLIIRNNPSLSTCAVNSICEYLVSPNGNTYIYENAPGCNSAEEIETACLNSVGEKTEAINKYSIYPNPASTEITVETNAEGSIIQLKIFNTQGSQLISRQITQPLTVVDISHLAKGIYIIKLTGVQSVRVLKIIKN